MAEVPSNFDLGLQIAALSGKLDAYQQMVKVELTMLQRDQERSFKDREDIHKELDALNVWRGWVTGLGFGLAIVVTALSVYATLRTAGIHF